MLHKTRGIVLNTTEYGESSLIAKIYTELFGLQSYIVNSVRKRKTKFHYNIFQPLTPVEMVVYHKERPGLQRLSDIRPSPLLTSIPFDVEKSSMVFFMDEILCRAIKEEEANDSLFAFLFDSILRLDAHPDPLNFHLLFLIQLTRHLGFFPSQNFSEINTVFNLMDGQFEDRIPNHPHYIDQHSSFHFYHLLMVSNNSLAEYELPIDEKRKLINNIIDYYRLHIEGIGEIKSHKILEQIWS